MIGFLRAGLETILSDSLQILPDLRRLSLHGVTETFLVFFEMSLIFPRGRHESLSNVNRNTLSLYVELAHDFIVIVRIKCCV